MSMDRFTIKAGEALQSAQRMAGDRGHAEVRPLHLLVSLCAQPEGIVGPVLQKLGSDPRAIAAAAEERLATYAKVTGQEQAQVSLLFSSNFQKICQTALNIKTP